MRCTVFGTFRRNISNGGGTYEYRGNIIMLQFFANFNSKRQSVLNAGSLRARKKSTGPNFPNKKFRRRDSNSVNFTRGPAIVESVTKSNRAPGYS